MTRLVRMTIVTEEKRDNLWRSARTKFFKVVTNDLCMYYLLLKNNLFILHFLQTESNFFVSRKNSVMISIFDTLKKQTKFQILMI